MSKIWFLFFLLLISFVIVGGYVSRNPLITDDLTPLSSCDKLIEQSDLLLVIPEYENHSLDLYPEWCEKMRSYHKTFGLHGINHEYHEFLKPVDKAKFTRATISFEKCFGYKPTIFRPPYNKISAENKALVESFNMTVYQETYLHHPYCHCQPQGLMKLLNQIIGC